MVVGDRSEFPPGRRVRVREDGRDLDSQPDERWLGKEGIIWYGTGSEEGGLANLYFVEFDSGEVELINPHWLESVD